MAGQAQVTYTFDNANRLRDITQGSSIVDITYDDANRPQVLSLPNTDSENYTFDDANELTQIAYKQGATNLGLLTYGYDAAGERATIGGTWARIAFPTAVATTIYNDDNRLTKWGTDNLAYDANGNVKTDGTNAYTFDDRNHLSGITGGITASFVYDGLGRRMKKTVAGITTQILYDKVNPVQELSSTGSPTANLLTGLGPDDRYVRAETATTRDFLTDAFGSTSSLADTAGAVQTSYTYEPYGKASASGGASTNSYQFTGRELDTATLGFFRARYYSPTSGRFLSEDPVGLGSGDPNFYTYAGDDAIDFIDPYGYAPNSCGDAFWLICRGVGNVLRPAGRAVESVGNAANALNRSILRLPSRKDASSSGEELANCPTSCSPQASPKRDIQNFDYLIGECERRLSERKGYPVRLTPDQRQRVHREISGEGYSDEDIIQICVGMFQ